MRLGLGLRVMDSTDLAAVELDLPGLGQSAGLVVQPVRPAGHRSDRFNEFVILLMGQQKCEVTFSNGCPTLLGVGRG